MATISTLAVNLIAHTSVFDKAMRRSRKRLTGFQRATQTINAKLLAFSRAATVAGVAVAGMSVKAFATFEKQMANVSTMLDKNTMKYMPEFTKGIKQMAVQFGEGTDTLSKGLYDILSASVAPAEAMNVLGASVKAAKAGMTDTAVAADAITTILNSYQMSADKAGKVSDILFAIVKRGKTTFAELAPNIGKVAAIASVAGLSFEEVGAALATMTRAGLQTELATTSLRGIINAFLKPTKESAEAAKAFGIELNSATLQSIGLTGVLEKLSAVNADQLAKIMPNVRALAGFAASLKQASGQASDLKLMLKSTGMTQEAFGKATNTLSYSLNQSWQMIKIIGVNLGSILAPAVKKIIAKFLSLSNSLIDMRNTFAKAFPNMTFFLKNFGKFMEFAMIRSIYHIAKFANQVVYFFTEVIPKALIFLKDNWKNIFVTIWSGTKSIFINMGKNLAEFFKAIVDALKGEGWSFEWTGLLEGFENTIGKFPKLAERKIGVIEKALKESSENILGELGEKYVDYMDEWEKKFGSKISESIEASVNKLKSVVDKTKKIDIKTDISSLGGEGREIDTRYTSVSGMALGGVDPVVTELQEQTELAKKANDILEIISGKESLA